MTYDIVTIVWREMMVLKRRLKTFLFSRMVSPLLYLLTFGLGLGKSVNIGGGVSYLDFVISGIIAMNSMMVSFNSVASPLCIARLLYTTFDEYQTAPISNTSFILGHAVSGTIRGFISSFIIFIIAYAFGSRINIDLYFLLVLLLNCLIFSFIGIIAAMYVSSHENLGAFSTYIITPMSFLCGTFFRLDNYPDFLATIISFLPLTPASSSLRSIGSGGAPVPSDIILLVFYFLVSGYLAHRFVANTRNN